MLAAVDNWIFFLLLAMFALLRLLVSKAAGASKDRSPPAETSPSPSKPSQSPATRRAVSSDEEQIRKFLEALGQPPTASPPPPVVPRSDVSPRPVAPVSPPRSGMRLPEVARKRAVVVAKKAAEIAPKIRPAEQLPRTVESLVRPEMEGPVLERRASSARTTPLPATEAYLIPTGAGQSDKSTSDLSSLFAEPSAVRRAIILREILGPPRSLQSGEELPGFA